MTQITTALKYLFFFLEKKKIGKLTVLLQKEILFEFILLFWVLLIEATVFYYGKLFLQMNVKMLQRKLTVDNNDAWHTDCE